MLADQQRDCQSNGRQPDTIKAFLRTTMIKTRICTRSGIVRMCSAHIRALHSACEFLKSAHFWIPPGSAKAAPIDPRKLR